MLHNKLYWFSAITVLAIGCNTVLLSSSRNEVSLAVASDLTSTVLFAVHSMDTVSADAVSMDSVAPSIYAFNLSHGVDTTVNPCKDFYEYANGQWRKDVVFPAKVKADQRTWNNFAALPKRTDNLVKTLIINSHKSYSSTKSQSAKAIGLFYESCMVADTLESNLGLLLSRKGVKDSTRSDMCISRTRRYLPGAVGQVFIEDLQSKRSIERMQLMLQEVKSQIRSLIEHHKLKSPEDIRLTLERLDKLFIRVGVPDKFVDYSEINISPTDYFKNKIEIANYNSLGSVNLIGSDSRERWKMSYFTANAFYNSAEHAIEVPPGIFSAPFFEDNGDDAINFAAVGVIIGHEMFHSLAASLVQSENPKMKDEIDSFKKINSELEAVDGWKTDGKRTYNEDVADLGGVRAAYQAWKTLYNKDKKNKDVKIDGFTPDQRFFLAYGRIWRAIWTAKTAGNGGAHAAPFARVNGTVRHIPEFAAAFGCKEGDAMVLPVNRRSKLW